LVEQFIRNEKVASSIPAIGTKYSAVGKNQLALVARWFFFVVKLGVRSLCFSLATAIREQIIRADNHSTGPHLPGFHRRELRFIAANWCSSQLGGT
jgi:hypothetical protein